MNNNLNNDYNNINDELNNINYNKSLVLASNNMPSIMLNIKIDINNIVDKIADTLKNDDKAIEILNRIGISEPNLNTISNQEVKNLELTIKSNIFTGNLYEFAISIDNEDDKILFNYTNYENKIYLVKSNKETTRIEVTDYFNSNNFSTIIYKGNAETSNEELEQIAFASGTANGNNNYVYKFSTSNVVEKKIDVTINVNNEFIDNSFKYNYIVSINNAENESKNNITINLVGKKGRGSNFSLDTTNFIDYDSLTQNDKDFILNRFNELLDNFLKDFLL